MHLKSHILPKNMKEMIKTDWIKKSIIKNESDSHLISKWRTWTQQLDSIRNESLVKIEPLFSELYYG